jgi:hypothetical protein
MQFLRQVIGSFASECRIHGATPATGRRRSPIGLETLESRNLLSIAGVSLQFGNIAIVAPKSSGNVAEVQIDPKTHNVEVSLNGQSEEFAASQVLNITYEGGAHGGDTFVNDTDLTGLYYGFGGGNTFTGGGAFNFMFFTGNDNTYNANGIYSDVFELGGSGDQVVNPSGSPIAVYSF